MKKLISLLAVAALCASAAFAQSAVYHATTPEEFFDAISYDADTLNALSVGIMCIGGDQGVYHSQPTHWAEGTDQYGDYLLGTITSAGDTLSNGVPALYFSNYDGLMTVDGTVIDKPAGTVLLGLANGSTGYWDFDVFIKNTSDVPVLLNGSFVLTPATVFDFDAFEASDFDYDALADGEFGTPSSLIVRSWNMTDGDAIDYAVDAGWADMDPIVVDTSDRSTLPAQTDEEGYMTSAAQYTENYTDYVLQPGAYLHWIMRISGDGGSYGYTGDSSLGNYFAIGLNLDVTKKPDDPTPDDPDDPDEPDQPDPTVLPEPATYAYALMGFGSLMGIKRRIRK